jgi:hypothetical protein
MIVLLTWHQKAVIRLPALLRVVQVIDILDPTASHSHFDLNGARPRQIAFQTLIMFLVKLRNITHTHICELKANTADKKSFFKSSAWITRSRRVDRPLFKIAGPRDGPRHSCRKLRYEVTTSIWYPPTEFMTRPCTCIEHVSSSEYKGRNSSESLILLADAVGHEGFDNCEPPFGDRACLNVPSATILW